MMFARRAGMVFALAAAFLFADLGNKVFAKPKDKDAAVKIIRPGETKYKKAKAYQTHVLREKRFRGRKQGQKLIIRETPLIEPAVVSSKFIDVKTVETDPPLHPKKSVAKPTGEGGEVVLKAASSQVSEAKRAKLNSVVVHSSKSGETETKADSDKSEPEAE